MGADMTARAPIKTCDYCDEEAPVRLIDNDGYVPDELICEACFYHDVASWDDLPMPKSPEDET